MWKQEKEYGSFKDESRIPLRKRAIVRASGWSPLSTAGTLWKGGQREDWRVWSNNRKEVESWERLWPTSIEVGLSSRNFPVEGAWKVLLRITSEDWGHSSVIECLPPCTRPWVWFSSTTFKFYSFHCFKSLEGSCCLQSLGSGGLWRKKKLGGTQWGDQEQ
jgi:hypothetical protein